MKTIIIIITLIIIAIQFAKERPKSQSERVTYRNTVISKRANSTPFYTLKLSTIILMKRGFDISIRQF